MKVRFACTGTTPQGDPPPKDKDDRMNGVRLAVSLIRCYLAFPKTSHAPKTPREI